MLRRIGILLLFAGCGSSASSTGIDVSTLECPPGSTLTYDTYGQLAIQEHCLSCHASKESPRLGTLEEIRANKTPILREAVASTAMPEGGDMTLEDRQLFGEWLACGAP